MITEVTWPMGKALAKVTRQEHSWSIHFGGGGSVTTESIWRLVTKAGICVTSEDHGQLFGLTSPVDAGARLVELTCGKFVIGCQIRPGSSDLVLTFQGGATLEFLNLSCGYEAWRAAHETEEVFCLGGGALLKGSKVG